MFYFGDICCIFIIYYLGLISSDNRDFFIQFQQIFLACQRDLPKQSMNTEEPLNDVITWISPLHRVTAFVCFSPGKDQSKGTCAVV